MAGKPSFKVSFCTGLLIAAQAFAPPVFSQPVNPSDSLALPPVVAPANPGVHRRKIQKRAPVPFFSGKLTLGTTYDDNILDYSARDEQLLTSGIQPDRFSVRTIDDVIYGASLQLNFNPALWKNHRTRLRVASSGDLYTRDGIKNQGEAGAGARQSLFRHAVAEVGIAYLPYYYVRNLYLRGHPPGKLYFKARYRRWTYSGAFTYDFSSRLDGQVRYSFETRDYNPEFNERDSKNHIVGGEIDYWLFAKRLRTDFAYDLNLTHAEGRNSPDSLVVDISNRAHRFTLDLFFRPTVWRKHPFQVTQRFAYELQEYTSQRPLDRFHFKRKDHEWWLRTGVSLALTRFLEAGVVYLYNTASTNSTDSAASVSLGNVGNYIRRSIDISLTVDF